MTSLKLITARLRLETRQPGEILAHVESLPEEVRALISPEWLARLHSATGPDPWTVGFVVFLRADGREVGRVGFPRPPGAEGSVELAYEISEAERNQGFATEACGAVARWALSDGGAQKLYAHTRVDGHASMRVLAKCGFHRIGEVPDPEEGRVVRWERD